MKNLINRIRVLHNHIDGKYFTDGRIVLDQDNENIVEWNVDGIDEPTESELNAADLSKIQEMIEPLQNRKKAYPSWQEQMEMIYKDQKNGTSTFKDHCDKVRSDNPKE